MPDDMRTPHPARRLLERRKHISNWGAIVGFVFTILSTAYTVICEDQISPQSLIVILLGIYITVFAAVYGFGNELTAEMGALRETVEDHADCLYVGRPSDAVAKYRERLEKAIKIRNTFVTFKVADDPDIKSYLAANPRNAIVGSKSWEDIFSEEALSFAEVKQFQNYSEQKYSPAVLRRPYPIINFVLLEFADEPPLVLFGWGFHHKDSVGTVYASKRLFPLFNRYWEALIDDTIALTDEGQVCLTRYQIKGLWLTVAFKGHATGNIPNESPRDIGLAVISVGDDQQIAIEIRRYDICIENGKVTVKTVCNTIKAKASQLQNRELWFVAEVQEKLIAGAYRFVGKDSGMRCFGDFIEQGQNEVIGIYGQQIDTKAAFPSDPADIRRYLSEYDTRVLSPWRDSVASPPNQSV